MLTELEATGVLPGFRRIAGSAGLPVTVAVPVSVGGPASSRTKDVAQGSGARMPSQMPPRAVIASQPATRAPQTGTVAAAPAARATPAATSERSGPLIERAARLDQREQALRQRERELADQRRVLAEEYRLLRTQRPQIAAPPAVRVHVAPRASSVAIPFAPARQETLWARFKRFMLGLAAPARGELDE